jgi:hypothetical protein
MARSFDGNPREPGNRDYVQCEKSRVKKAANPGINPHGSVNQVLHRQHGGMGPVYAPKGAPMNPVGGRKAR